MGGGRQGRPGPSAPLTRPPQIRRRRRRPPQRVRRWTDPWPGPSCPLTGHLHLPPPPPRRSAETPDAHAAAAVRPGPEGCVSRHCPRGAAGSGGGPGRRGGAGLRPGQGRIAAPRRQPATLAATHGQVTRAHPSGCVR